MQDTTGMQMPTMDIPGMPGGQMGMVNLGDMLGKAFGGRTRKRKMMVVDAHEPLVAEESDKLLDQDTVVREAIELVEQHGIVFLDEVDKTCARSDRQGAGVSGEGVHGGLRALDEGENE